MDGTADKLGARVDGSGEKMTPALDGASELGARVDGFGEKMTLALDSAAVKLGVQFKEGLGSSGVRIAWILGGSLLVCGLLISLSTTELVSIRQGLSGAFHLPHCLYS